MYLFEFVFSYSSDKYPEVELLDHLVVLFFFFYLSFILFRAAPESHGGSQAGGPIGTVAAGLYHSHSNAKSELRLRPTPQPQQRQIQAESVTYTTVPGNARSLTQQVRPGIEPQLHGS